MLNIFSRILNYLDISLSDYFPAIGSMIRSALKSDWIQWNVSIEKEILSIVRHNYFREISRHKIENPKSVKKKKIINKSSSIILCDRGWVKGHGHCSRLLLFKFILFLSVCCSSRRVFFIILLHLFLQLLYICLLRTVSLTHDPADAFPP